MAIQDRKEIEAEKKSRDVLFAAVALLAIAILSVTAAYLSAGSGTPATPTSFAIVEIPPSSNPTYTSVITTAYYIPSYADFQGRQWCTICRENLGGLEACKLDE